MKIQFLQKEIWFQNRMYIVLTPTFHTKDIFACEFDKDMFMIFGNQQSLQDLACVLLLGADHMKVYPRMKREAVGSEYYKAGLRNISSMKKIEEYKVPIQSSESLNHVAINDYVERVNVEETPTALSISFLDIKYPLNDFDEIWVYSHFLLDGHHKMFAADKAQKAITLLSFLSIDESFANKEQLEKLFQVLT